MKNFIYCLLCAMCMLIVRSGSEAEARKVYGTYKTPSGQKMAFYGQNGRRVIVDRIDQIDVRQSRRVYGTYVGPNGIRRSIYFVR